jgi:hypothetical protein
VDGDVRRLRGEVCAVDVPRLIATGRAVPHTARPIQQYDATGGSDPAGCFLVRPAGRTHLEVKVLYTPDTGKC